MHKIKHLHNHTFRWIIIALLSVMFCVLLGGYRLNIQATHEKLSNRTWPMKEITSSLLAQSGSSDNLLNSSIASYESMISWLELTPSVSNALHQYVSNLYTVAWAFDAAKAALPQTNDWEYLFNRWTISLLETATYMSGDIMQLYSGKQSIADAVRYLSGAVISTSDEKKIYMSKHNISVALAAQIGVEVKICSENYHFFADTWWEIKDILTSMQESYTEQLTALDKNIHSNQCVEQYKQKLSGYIAQMPEKIALSTKMNIAADAKRHTYEREPLQCPMRTDIYDEVISLRQYHDELKIALAKDSLVKEILMSGNMSDFITLCENNSTGNNQQNFIGDLLSALTWNKETFEENEDTNKTTLTGSYESLPDDTQNLVNDIYQQNIQYIQTMQQTQQDNNYRPLQRLQELFKEFYGDTTEFLK